MPSRLRVDSRPLPEARPRNRRGVVVMVALALVVALVTARIVTSEWVPRGVLPDRVQDLITLATSLLVESLPFVVLGIALSVVVRVWLPEGLIVRVLPRTPVLRRAALSLVGMFLPVCECGNVPLARGFVVRGLTVGESMTFLFAAPIINPITIVTTHQAFGFDDGILVARLLGGFVIANLLGWLFSRHPDPSSLLTARFNAECATDAGPASSRWSQSVDLFVRESATLLPALTVGAIVAGAVQTVVPRSVLIALGSDPLWSVLALMALALVISVCSNVDAFFILPFASTFMPGSIVAFLIFGALVDIKMLALLRTTFTVRTLLIVTGIVALSSAAIGWGVDLVV
ncbi:permease [uncultured Schumannella sp.]|uniref:permease n=1 Tax=uncultured Schumannella sp. TaxID=1195956 RepID=UPI0025E89CD7|nr:permease [uncultured Schumannella sp.]